MNNSNHTEQIKIDIKELTSLLGNSLYIDMAQSLIPIITAGIGIAGVAIKGMQVWLEERKSRKIRLKNGDIEIEICGKLTEEEIMKKLEIFNKFKREQTLESLLSTEIDILDENKSNKIDIKRVLLETYSVK